MGSMDGCFLEGFFLFLWCFFFQHVVVLLVSELVGLKDLGILAVSYVEKHFLMSLRRLTSPFSRLLGISHTRLTGCLFMSSKAPWTLFGVELSSHEEGILRFLNYGRK